MITLINSLRKGLYFSLFFILFFTFSHAATITYTGTSGGNWGTASNWSSNPSLPGSSDSVIIPNGKSVVINVNAVCSSLNMGTGGTTTTLTFSGTSSLAVTNVINFAAVTGNCNHTIAVGTKTVSCRRVTMAANGNSNRIAQITIDAGGKFTASGDVVFGATANAAENKIVFLGAGTLVIGGSFTHTTGTFTTIAGCKVIFNGATAQTIKSGYTFRDLQFYGTGTKTFSGTTLTLVGGASGDSLDIRAGTIVDVGTMLIQANSSGVVFNIAGTIQTACLAGLTGSTTTTLKSSNSPTITLVAGSVIEYDATSSQTVTTGTTYQGLTITGNSTKTIGSNLTVNEDLIINSSATLAHNATTFTISGDISGSGNLTTTSGILNVGGDFTLSGVYTCGTGTVNYNKSGTQIVDGITYNNLTISGSSAKSLAGNASVGATLLLTSGTLNLNGKALTLAGTFSGSGSGTLVGSSTSTLFVNGTGALGTLRFDNSTRANKTIDSLIVNRTTSGAITLNNAATADTLLIGSLLTLTDGVITTNDRLLLLSNASNTARVGPVGNGSLSGNIHVERFIPGGAGKRKWRLMSFPVNNGSNVMTWQAIKDYILVTGTGGATNNFDVSSTNNPSIRTYTESVSGASLNGWTNPTNITNTIATGRGFEVFIRGTRGLSNQFLNWTTPDNVTFRFSGTMNTGTVTTNLTYTNSGNIGDGLTLVGNPYPSQIDFTSGGITRVNCDDKFWCYNPNTTLYGMYDISVGSGTNSMTRYIASGQGFFVQATSNSSPSFAIAESAKSSVTPNSYFKNEKVMKNQLLKLSLNIDSTLSDELIIAIDSNASIMSTDRDDALKFFNDEFNFYSRSIDNVNLTINNYPIPSASDTINLSVFSFDSSGVRDGDYFIKTEELRNVDTTYRIYLLDMFSDIKTEIIENTKYDFSITSDSSSYGSNRFKLILQNKNTGIKFTNTSFSTKIYPNPSSNIIYIDVDESEKSLGYNYIIIDVLGREIEASTLINNQVNVENLTAGVYYLKLQNKLGSSINKFIKR